MTHANINQPFFVKQDIADPMPTSRYQTAIASSSSGCRIKIIFQYSFVKTIIGIKVGRYIPDIPVTASPFACTMNHCGMTIQFNSDTFSHGTGKPFPPRGLMRLAHLIRLRDAGRVLEIDTGWQLTE
ncbi:MAG: hypothetical protein WBJ03_04285 [Moraxellaceae bacterium]